MVATVLTLLYVPALYLIVEDIINLFTGRVRKAEGRDQMADVR
jgi:hypothetical protein